MPDQHVMLDQRVYVMNAWNERLGAAVDPVGVLALDADTGEHLVVWLPGTLDASALWRARLQDVAAADLPAAAAAWCTVDTAVSLTVVDDVDPHADLQTNADSAVDQLLAVVLPGLD